MPDATYIIEMSLVSNYWDPNRESWWITAVPMRFFGRSCQNLSDWDQLSLMSPYGHPNIWVIGTKPSQRCPLFVVIGTNLSQRTNGGVYVTHQFSIGTFKKKKAF